MSEAESFSKALLIVDSSVFIIERLVNMLEEVKNIKKVFTATDYDTALEILYKERADIVLLDIQMREKNGIDLLKHIIYHFPETKVIVLSNLASDFYQKLCMAEGALHFVDKTKDFDKIPELISAV
ncbi:MAG: response regulator transcription factor [Ferruginibacter sp.]